MPRPTCSTPGAVPSTLDHAQAVKCVSNTSDLSDLLPQIDNSESQISNVPDSVLLMSLGSGLFSPIAKLEHHSPKNTSNEHGDSSKFASNTNKVQFDEAEVRMERDTIEALHGIICRNNVSVRTLFNIVSKDLNKSWPFVTDAGLETYIKNRSFVFEISNRIHNRGYGYRENFVHIITYVDAQSQKNGFCTLKDLMTNVIDELPVYAQDDLQLPWTDSWFTEKKLDESDVLELLSHDHVELFNLEKSSTGYLSDTKVRLTCTAFGIVSLWSDCFPPMPSSLVWDESRIYSFTCSLSYVHEHHAIGTIQSGIYSGRLVYIHRSRVGPPDLRRTLAVGGMLSCTAHVTFNTTAQFRALSVVNNFNSFEVRKIGVRRSYDRDGHHSDQRREARPTFAYRKFLRRAAESELNMITFADDLLSDSMYSHDGLQRRLSKYKSNHRNSPFANFQEFEFFIRQRPHLYTTDDHGTRRASPKEREIALAFIQMINEFGFCGVSKIELRYKLVNSSYPLKSIVVDKSLDEYIKEIFPVLEIVHLLNPPEDLVMLRGTYMADEHLFVHHFKPCYLPFD